ncbi:hypothetical protein LXL04_020973 [Taraxacum kok-saghyz]
MTIFLVVIASFSHLVKKPSIKVYSYSYVSTFFCLSRYRFGGYFVWFRGNWDSAYNFISNIGGHQLEVYNFLCEKTRDDPYEVQITIPVEGYDPIQFTLTKMCGSTQNKGGSSTEEGSRNSQ